MKKTHILPALALTACLVAPLTSNAFEVTALAGLIDNPIAQQLISVATGQGLPLVIGAVSDFPLTPMLLQGPPMLGQVTGPLLGSSSLLDGLGELPLPGL